uniref:Uncharacterized protein n=1 Tax=viral metagenome TaxID=1070528 RepID=A0A6C0EJR0_9ZZZZ
MASLYKVKKIPFPLRKGLKVFRSYLSDYYSLNKKYGIHEFASPNYINSGRMIAENSDGAYVGSGSSAIDMILEDGNERIGIDLKSVKMVGGGLSGESSLLQNFSAFGSNLDVLFQEKRANEIIRCFQKGLVKKYDDVMTEYNLTKLGHLWIIYKLNNVYFQYFELDATNLILSAVSSKATKSVVVDGIIPREFGVAKIYSSKKRLEVRLKSTAKKWLLFG